MHTEVSPAELSPVKELFYSYEGGTHAGTAEHRIIEGDNLPVMATLAAKEPASFDRIYLDPPYNSGNSVRGSWVYDDTGKGAGWNPSAVEGAAVGPAAAGPAAGAVEAVPQSRRSRWLLQLTPRLILARQLLTETGIILVSISERELEFLAVLMSEIFGSENRIAIMSIRSLHT
ncbi:MAG: hypothetical protein LC641_08325, partial [Spirochaeta sp.]|nr:hypothetical protein [Spirochaeta sp.]